MSGYELLVDADDGHSHCFDDAVEQVAGGVFVAGLIHVLANHVGSVFLLISLEEGFFIDYFGQQQVVDLWIFDSQEYSNGFYTIQMVVKLSSSPWLHIHVWYLLHDAVE